MSIGPPHPPQQPAMPPPSGSWPWPSSETIIEHHDEKGLRGRFKIVGRIIELIADGVGYLKLLTVQGAKIMAQIDDLNAVAARIEAAATRIAANPPTTPPDLAPAIASLTDAATKLETVSPAPAT